MYEKYTYWMNGKQIQDLRDSLNDRDIEPFEAKKAVCVPLSKRVGVGIVDPATWSGFEICRRQLSWYDVSEFRGKYLVISDRPLTDYGIDVAVETIISESKFKPEKVPGKDISAITRLAELPDFQNKCPEPFFDIDGMTPAEQDRWLKIMGVRGISYRDLFVIHCANHANFIQPEYYTETPGGIAPYSIGKTNRSCSACLQFFNIVGKAFKTKYVVPCPGAVLFAGLKVNRYYKVDSAEAALGFATADTGVGASTPFR